MIPDLNDLEAKARAATPGRWTAVQKPSFDGTDYLLVDKNGRPLINGGDGPDGDYVTFCHWADVEFTAAAGPEVVLAMVARIRELEEALKQSMEMLKSDNASFQKIGEGINELAKGLDAFGARWGAR